MRWDNGVDSAMATTPAGVFYAERYGDVHYATWEPIGSTDVVAIGRYRTLGAAKGACKRYAKRMAAAFKAMGKAGWQ